MKIKLLILAAWIIFGASAIISEQVRHSGRMAALRWNYRDRPALIERPAPPGYRILCDGRGRFGVQYPDGRISTAVRTSRSEAIEFAWFTTIPEPELPPAPIWKVCD